MIFPVSNQEDHPKPFKMLFFYFLISQASGMPTAMQDFGKNSHESCSNLKLKIGPW